MIFSKNNLVSSNPDFKPVFAKGTGDPTIPIPITGGFSAKAGEVYTVFTGYNAIIIMAQCGVSVNKSIIMLFPERTSFEVTDGMDIMFDRSVAVATVNYTT